MGIEVRGSAARKPRGVAADSADQSIGKPDSGRWAVDRDRPPASDFPVGGTNCGADGVSLVARRTRVLAFASTYCMLRQRNAPMSPSASPCRLWQLRTKCLTFDELPAIMGIVNVTPDSFSDGGRFFEATRGNRAWPAVGGRRSRDPGHWWRKHASSCG